MGLKIKEWENISVSDLKLEGQWKNGKSKKAMNRILNSVILTLLMTSYIKKLEDESYQRY